MIQKIRKYREIARDAQAAGRTGLALRFTNRAAAVYAALGYYGKKKADAFLKYVGL